MRARVRVSVRVRIRARVRGRGRGRQGLTVLVLVLVLVLVVVRTTAAPAQPLGAPAPRSDDLIVVLRHPDKPTGVRQGHLVGREHALRQIVITVEQGVHRAAGPLVLRSLALHLVADSEAQRRTPRLEALGRGAAVVEGGGELLRLQPLADEDHLAVAGLVLRPRIAEGALEGHVHLGDVARCGEMWRDRG